MESRFRILLLAASLLVFSGCNSGYFVKENFDRTSKSYSNMLRWHEFDTAAAYVDTTLLEEYRERVEAAREVSILDLRILNAECDPENRTAQVLVQLDYNISPSATVKTVTDLQKWRYLSEGENKGWRLESLLPEFK